ncbi:S1C family serine protease [Persicirhabdus sediminis]|uniref:Serine protease n=1 Tax=Persicirhabdus sediminis TaxID=454144 RepID=A0A8J7MK80_9BACT|nr:S1C family serine protease [Persicirhabdus sediminis]MBK1792538.1 serine protease [Persicirhabdus sediminis]
MKFSISAAVMASAMMVSSALADSVAIELANPQAKDQALSAMALPVPSRGILASVAIVGSDPSKAQLVLADGNKDLKLLAFDDVSRIALYELPESLKSADKVKFGNGSMLEPAQALYLDHDDQNKVSRLVSKDKRFQGKVLPLALYRVNHDGELPVAGSPIYNEAGDMVALVHQPAYDVEGCTYALPIEVLMRAIDVSQDQGRVARCWIGIAMELQNEAPVVVGVRPASPARKAGIVKGDVIISVGDRQTSDYADVVDAFYYLVSGEAVKFKVLRGTQLVELDVTPELVPGMTP